MNQNAKCSDASITSEAGLATFNDIPLTDLKVHGNAELPGATNTSIDCVNSATGTHIGNSPVPSSDPADMSAPALTPGTYTCMVVVDP